MLNAKKENGMLGVDRLIHYAEAGPRHQTISKVSISCLKPGVITFSDVRSNVVRRTSPPFPSHTYLLQSDFRNAIRAFRSMLLKC